MSLDVATCACRQRYRIVREPWDQRFNLAWCRECRPDRVGASTGLPKLDREPEYAGLDLHRPSRSVEHHELLTHQGHIVTCRDYPGLTPPATFYDCWTCGVTWESGR